VTAPDSVRAAAERLTGLDAILADNGDAKDLELVLGWVLGQTSPAGFAVPCGSCGSLEVGGCCDAAADPSGGVR
jgi:hypothetical protein